MYSILENKDVLVLCLYRFCVKNNIGVFFCFVGGVGIWVCDI